MKGIILYQSKYGATKKYAEWLTEATGFDCMETKKANLSSVQNYDVIILGGGVYASCIAGFSFLKKNVGNFSGKKLAVFAVGASPYDEKVIQQIRDFHFKDALSNIPLFYCRGTMDEDKLTFAHRTLCRMLQKAIAKQNPADRDPLQNALFSSAGQKCDWTDKTYLEPLLRYVGENANE